MQIGRLDFIQQLQADRTATYGLFVRLIGLVYFCAFASLVPQIHGLIGQHGILPCAKYLSAVLANNGVLSYFGCPTLLWFSSASLPVDTLLTAIVSAGVVLSVFLIFDCCALYCTALLYLMYLSVVSVGQEFLSYQWDMLLLQGGFLAVVVALLRPCPKAVKYFAWLTFFFLWLDFRLMFSSGLCKIASSDTTWADLTALTYHFSTQPLPTPLATVVNAMPVWLSKIVCGLTLAIELLVPFLLFGPPKVRLFAIAQLTFLQLAIVLTGNYCFFNWLTIFLYVPLLDDALLQKYLGSFKNRLVHPDFEASQVAGQVTRKIAASAMLAICGFNLFMDVGGKLFYGIMPEPILLARSLCSTCGISNGYGLFAAMTIERPEIIIEGSDDGKNYQLYQFKYKVSRAGQAPPIVAPHQPRLDWQMWFEGLNATGGDYARTHEINPRPNPWFIKFLIKLAANEPSVTSLLATNPFAVKPPKYLRARIVNYTLLPPSEVLESGNWWRCQDVGTYFDTRRLESIQPAPAR